MMNLIVFKPAVKSKPAQIKRLRTVELLRVFMV
jgi:hypothetical protein